MISGRSRLDLGEVRVEQVQGIAIMGRLGRLPQHVKGRLDGVLRLLLGLDVDFRRRCRPRTTARRGKTAHEQTCEEDANHGWCFISLARRASEENIDLACASG